MPITSSQDIFRQELKREDFEFLIETSSNSYRAGNCSTGAFSADHRLLMFREMVQEIAARSEKESLKKLADEFGLTEKMIKLCIAHELAHDSSKDLVNPPRPIYKQSQEEIDAIRAKRDSYKYQLFSSWTAEYD